MINLKTALGITATVIPLAILIGCGGGGGGGGGGNGDGGNNGGTPVFVGMGDLAGGSVSSSASGISGNGIAVGQSNDAAGARPITFDGNTLTGISSISGSAQGISSDGFVVGGTYQDSNGNFQAFKWTSAGGVAGLGFLDAANKFSAANALSGDGSTIVGGSNVGANLHPFKWTQAGGMIDLGLPANTTSAIATGVSLDGSTIVGLSNATGGPRVFLWTQGGGATNISGTFTGGGGDAQANGVSGNGSVIIGTARENSSQKAFRYTSGTGFEMLPDLTGGTESEALGTNSDGSVVVGYTKTGATNNDTEAFYWTATGGTQRLSTLASTAGGTLTGWTLLKATAVSPDGKTVVGIGKNPSDQTEGFVVRLP